MHTPFEDLFLEEADFSFTILQTLDEFDALESEWNELLGKSEASIFQTFEWQQTWWSFFGERQKNCRLFLVVIRKEDRIRGIAPLYVEHIGFGVLGLRRLSFIGREVSDYLDILAERGYEESVARGLIEILVSLKLEFDVAVLEDMPDRSSFHHRLYDGFFAQSFTGDLFQATQCPHTLLKETWETSLESFTKKHRKDISYELRNINRKFSVEFELTSHAMDVPDSMNDFVAMHQERWTHAGYPGVFQDTIQADFHRAVAVKCFERGWLFLAFLRLNGRRVAVNYAFHFRDTVMTYLNGMIDAAEISKFSPGKVLHIFSMEESAKRKCKIYDFMRGQERYKYALGAIDVPNWTLILYHKGKSSTYRKLKIHFLANSFRRRLRKERMMLMHIVNKSSWFSSDVLAYLVERLKSISQDGLQKIKQPEKTLLDKTKEVHKSDPNV